MSIFFTFLLSQAYCIGLRKSISRGELRDGWFVSIQLSSLRTAVCFVINVITTVSLLGFTSGTTCSNVMEAVKIMLTEGPKERFSRQFSLFDRDGDGWLIYSEIELAFSASTDPVQVSHVGCSYLFDLCNQCVLLS